jgi:hypothetical protein
LALARFDTNGQPDLSFGVDGVATIQILNMRESNHNEVKVLDDGKLLILVNGEGLFTGEFALVRLHPDGSRDTTFGNNANSILISAETNRLGRCKSSPTERL